MLEAVQSKQPCNEKGDAKGFLQCFWAMRLPKLLIFRDELSFVLPVLFQPFDFLVVVDNVLFKFLVLLHQLRLGGVIEFLNDIPEGPRK